jgi:hypothetical protein
MITKTSDQGNRRDTQTVTPMKERRTVRQINFTSIYLLHSARRRPVSIPHSTRRAQKGTKSCAILTPAKPSRPVARADPFNIAPHGRIYYHVPPPPRSRSVIRTLPNLAFSPADTQREGGRATTCNAHARLTSGPSGQGPRGHTLDVMTAVEREPVVLMWRRAFTPGSSCREPVMLAQSL